MSPENNVGMNHGHDSNPEHPKNAFARMINKITHHHPDSELAKAAQPQTEEAPQTPVDNTTSAQPTTASESRPADIESMDLVDAANESYREHVGQVALKNVEALDQEGNSGAPIEDDKYSDINKQPLPVQDEAEVEEMHDTHMTGDEFLAKTKEAMPNEAAQEQNRMNEAGH